MPGKLPDGGYLSDKNWALNEVGYFNINLHTLKMWFCCMMYEFRICHFI